ncbi:MAG TPA: cob(I)yrinic acid a,c-diamide adenosyltransferase [Thiobacillaceae bacterium]|nr:cob(I)yrinic acid a,c-diamide adenosyltransferase [Thiobacillaceae bacterium]
MAKRLTRITTRTGDDGTTGLAGNIRVSKDAPRIEAMGEVDELNSQIGLLLTDNLPEPVAELLTRIQHHLFDLGAELAMPEHAGVTQAKLAALDEAVAHYNAALPPLKEFILPGGTYAAALCHVCRTVCRRAERRIVTLNQSEKRTTLLVPYLNRLSDLLFILARVLNREASMDEPYWSPGR